MAFQTSERLMAPEPSPRDVPAQLLSREQLLAEAGWAVRPFRIYEGCTEVEFSVPAPGAVDKFFLAPLPSPEMSLRGVEFYAPLLGLSSFAVIPEKH